MGRDRENEKQFNNYLDRILRGEDIRLEPSANAELRDAVEFARKIAAAGVMPDEQYQAQLKADLLRKLEERQVPAARPKADRGSFWDVFRRSPVWQGAIAALLVIIALAIVWRAGVFQPEITGPDQTTTAPGTVKPAPTTTKPAPVTTAASTSAPGKGIGGMLVSIDAVTDKSSYNTGETVKIELSMKNISGSELTVEDFPPILSVMREDTKQPVYTFSAGTATRTLAPDYTLRYTYTWPQADFYGQPVSGSFYIELEDLEYNGAPIKLNLNNPVSFEILPDKLY